MFCPNIYPLLQRKEAKKVKLPFRHKATIIMRLSQGELEVMARFTSDKYIAVWLSKSNPQSEGISGGDKINPVMSVASTKTISNYLLYLQLSVYCSGKLL